MIAERARIALVVNNLERGGAQSLLLELMDRLDRKRFDPVLVYLRHPNDHAALLEQKGHEAIHCRVTPALPVRELKKLAELFAERQFEIIHAHTDYAAFACRLAGLLAPPTRHVAHYHNIYERKLNAAYVSAEQLLGPSTDRYVACSGAVEDFMRERVGLGQFRLQTIVNGISLEPFREAAHQRDHAREAFALSPSVFHIVHIARMKPVKKPLRIVEALAHCEFMPGRPMGEWRLTFIGDGDERAMVEARVRELDEKLEAQGLTGFRSRIVFAGNRDDVPRWLAAADLSVLLSDAEGLPISIIESLAAGVPCMVSDISPMTAVIQDRLNGMVVQRESAEMTAQALVALRNEPPLREQLSAAAARDANQYSVESFIAQTEQLYEELIQARPLLAELGTLGRSVLFLRARRLVMRSFADYKKQKRDAAA